VIPDAILSQLAGSETVIAVDLGHMNIKALLAKIPDECAREVLRATGVIVVAMGAEPVGVVTDVPKNVALSCAKNLASSIGISVTPTATGFDLEIADRPVSATWSGRTATIVERGHAPPKGDPPAALMALLAKAPRSAKGVLVQANNPPKHDIKTVVGWLETRDDNFILTLVFEGTSASTAHETATGVIAGFKRGAGNKGLVLDEKWFAIRDSGNFSTVVATVPYDLGQH
jgi:hypothetical protein